MGRRLRTTVICHPDGLLPKLVDHDGFIQHNESYKLQMKDNHDNRYVRPLRPLSEGEVWFRSGTSDTVLTKGTVITPPNVARHHKVQSDSTQNILTRNRSAIVSTRSGREVRPPHRLIEEE